MKMVLGTARDKSNSDDTTVDHEVQTLGQNLFGQPDGESEREWPGTEALLRRHIMALNDVFVEMLQICKNKTEMQDIEKGLNLAFTAQDQCRTTLETMVYVQDPDHNVELTEQVHQDKKPRPRFSVKTPISKKVFG